MEIIRDNFKALKRVSEEVEDMDEARDLIEKLEEVLETEPHGVGLSAIQIGIPKKVSIIRDEETEIDLINPKIVDKWDLERYRNEGCLSFMGLTMDTGRYRVVRVEYTDRNGNKQNKVFQGMDAIIIQHEIGHQKGNLFIDRAWRKFN